MRFLRFLLPALLLALAACAKRETPVDEGIRTGTLLVGNQNEPASLDPQLAEAFTDQVILVALFEGLTALDEATAQPVPAVAERWDVSPDGLTYTFHLRPGQQWSNGDPLTAEDFAYSFRRILSPKLASSYSYMLWPIKNAEAYNSGTLTDFSKVGVAVIDPLTLRLTLEHPTPYLPALAAHPTWMPVHRATIEKYGRIDDRSTAWTNPGNLVGNGAFTLTEWHANDRIVVAKNPRYRDAAQNHLNRVVFLPVENAEVEERNFRAGQVHVTFSLPAAKLPTYRAESPSPLRVDPFLRTFYLNFNTTKPPLDNPKVRRALALGLDRAALAQAVYNGSRAPAHTFTPPNCGGYDLPAGQPDDFAAARALLAEAGYPGGKGLPAFPLTVLNDDTQPRVAEAIQAMWQRELGVRLTIEPCEQKTWIQRQQTLAHTIGIMGWVGDFADPVTFLNVLKAGGGNNWTGWASPAYDALLAEAARTAEPAARLALLRRAETLMLDAAPVAPLVFDARAYALHPAVRNWAPSPLGFHRFQLIELRN
ncbi:MAG: peptide ABC transporter substrate-binding protein [Verrucomicrobia bacterium]|nr:peptide ABC transporter substrate-binding protein [Verrucomicrobiota bacterium]